MSASYSSEEADLAAPIKWIILARIGFAIVLILSGLVFSTGESLSFFSQPFLHLYRVSALILVLSIFYLVWLNRGKHLVFLAYLQTIADTFAVSAIIFCTGGYNSIFTFLFLVVIICSAILLFQKGSLILAAVCSLQYGLLIELEYYRVIHPYLGELLLSRSINESHVTYRVIIFTVACYAVAILSGILATQLRGARQELKMAQEHLKRVEKMAAMDEMISGIAHEVKNPLASLSGSIQLLQEDTVPGSYEDKLMQIILRETDRLKNIVNDLRFFAKPSKVNAEQADLPQLIEETIALFVNDPSWEDRIQIELDIEPGVAVFIDPDHFKQIFWNLMRNAAQAIQGNGMIRIKLKSYKKTKVYLTIEDTGSGIEKEQARHIFDPFYTTKAEGTGLGLSIIHRLIDTYNGMIDFETFPGKGSVFTVLFRKDPA
jgi:two-component system sensor histidine kinase HydH